MSEGLDDEVSSRVLLNLQASYDAKGPVDLKLIDDFIPIINTTIIDNNSSSYLSIINQILIDESYHIIDPHHILIPLLEKILSYISFQQIVSIYSTDYIMVNLLENKNIEINKLILSLINRKLNEIETIQFLESISYQLIQAYLTNRSLDLSIVNQIELIIQNLIDYNHHDLLNKMLNYNDLYNTVRSNEDETLLLARFLDYLLILIPYIIESDQENSLNKHYYQYNVDNFKIDPLFLILLIQFYEKLIQKLKSSSKDLIIFRNIESILIQLFSDYIDAKFDDFINDEIINVLIKLSYIDQTDNVQIHQFTNKLLSTTNILKSYNLLKVYEYNSSDLKILSFINANVLIEFNDQVYEEIIVNLNLLSNKLYFPILINLIPSSQLFEKLIQNSPYLSSNSLSKLSTDRLFQILLQVSNFNHSKQYLFNNLPSIINDHLISNDKAFINNDLYHLKIEILSNLLHDINDDNIWKSNLSTSLQELKVGKKITPQVDIIDETI
ncbi:DNA mismatch repair protein HSM3 [Scheffersomyces coipomensis]|uniref:DNA mismatch repair protein HSM3 n=1 Tax=Scheffersomyces coipomensis TaxID=1788519 RepID=UPI00315CA6FF